MFMSYIPLIDVLPGQNAQFCELLGNATMRQRLIGLGLVPGAKLKVLQNRRGQGLMISLGNNKIAIGKTLSQKIIVSPGL